MKSFIKKGACFFKSQKIQNPPEGRVTKRSMGLLHWLSRGMPKTDEHRDGGTDGQTDGWMKEAKTITVAL